MVAVPSRGRADLHQHAPEADAAGELYRRYERQIYAYCFSRLRSREEAEDAVQSTFLNAFRALQRDVAPEHEIAWLYKIAENVCLTRVRSSVRRRRVETPGDLEAISEVVPAHEPDAAELVNLPQALESMPEQQRKALLLREWQGLSYREIAEEMQLSQSAVETLLFRARRTLASGLADEPERKKSKLARLRAGGDAGAIVALIKTLLFSGGAKVVLVGAVAASGVVGISPGTRHSIDDLFVPHMKAATRVHHAPAAPKARTAVAPVAPVVSRPVYVAPVARHASPVAHVAKKPHPSHPAVAAGQERKHGPTHLGRHGRIDGPIAPVAPPPVAEAPLATATAQTPLEPVQPAQTTTEQQPAKDAPVPPAPVVPPVAPPPAQSDRQHGNGGQLDGHGQGNGDGHWHDGHGK